MNMQPKTTTTSGKKKTETDSKSSGSTPPNKRQSKKGFQLFRQNVQNINIPSNPLPDFVTAANGLGNRMYNNIASPTKAMLSNLRPPGKFGLTAPEYAKGSPMDIMQKAIGRKFANEIIQDLMQINAWFEEKLSMVDQSFFNDVCQTDEDRNTALHLLFNHLSRIVAEKEEGVREEREGGEGEKGGRGEGGGKYGREGHEKTLLMTVTFSDGKKGLEELEDLKGQIRKVCGNFVATSRKSLLERDCGGEDKELPLLSAEQDVTKIMNKKSRLALHEAVKRCTDLETLKIVVEAASEEDLRKKHFADSLDSLRHMGFVMKDYVKKNPSQKVADFMYARLNIENRNSLEYMCLMNNNEQIKELMNNPHNPQSPSGRKKILRKRTWSSKSAENLSYLEGVRFSLSYYAEFGSDLTTLERLIEVEDDAAGLCSAVNGDDGNTLIHYICKNAAAEPMMIAKLMLCAGSDLIYILFTKNKDGHEPAKLTENYNLPETSRNLIEELTSIEELKECKNERSLKEMIDQKVKANKEENIILGAVETYDDEDIVKIIGPNAKKRAQKARKISTMLQQKMFDHSSKPKFNKKGVEFQVLKEHSRKEVVRLQGYLSILMKRYMTSPWFTKVAEIPLPSKYEDNPQQKRAEHLDLDAEVQWSLAQASWNEERFREILTKLANVFNEPGQTCNAIVTKFGLNAKKWQDFKIHHDNKFVLDEEKRDTVVKVKFGPPKSFSRAKVKAQEKKQFSLKDLNRVTFEFEDPGVMGLFYDCLENLQTGFGFENGEGMKVVRVKNKYTINDAEVEYDQPPCLNITMLMEREEWLVEVQMLFKRILELKKEMHHYYELERATDAFAVLSRCFKGPLVKKSEDGLGDDDKSLDDGHYLLREALARHPYTASTYCVLICSALVGRRRFHYALLLGTTFLTILFLLKRKKKI
ncbi:hypothetical protein TrVE_jg4875 [Triparma verrucosa]|uniref:Uncharacterized protein n=1 Tax=Triparma verrucosa TaxID=1606542 RepID=A0A9W6Z575_9STRA|nr:hypothetical protein TrVE_jg4875 [Triparma verrucosa]